MPDYHEILKVKHGATKEEIRQAYERALFNKPRFLNDHSLAQWYEQIESAKEHLLERSKRRIQYTAKDILINGLYVNCNGKSYILSNYDDAVIRKDSESNYYLIGIVLIILGILSISFFVGPVILAIGITLLFIKNYFLVLISEDGDTPLIYGSKYRMKKIARKIKKAMGEFTS